MNLRLDTGNVQPNDRPAYGQEVVCNTFVRVGCTLPRQQLFHGQLESRQIGELSVVYVLSSAQGVIRDLRRNAHSDNEFILVSLAHEGRSQVSQEGREALLDAGDFTIYDTRRPIGCTLTGHFGRPLCKYGAPH